MQQHVEPDADLLDLRRSPGGPCLATVQEAPGQPRL